MTDTMQSAVAWLLLGLSLLPLAGTVGADGCTDPCADGNLEDDCPPDCALCVCCRSPRPAVVGVAAVVAPLALRHGWSDEPPSRPAPPAPREILHVPRLRAA